MDLGSDLQTKLEVWVWRRTVLVLSPSSVPHMKQTCTHTQQHCFLTFTSSEIFLCLNYWKKAVGLNRVSGHFLTPNLAGFTWLCPSQAPPCLSPGDHRTSLEILPCSLLCYWTALALQKESSSEKTSGKRIYSFLEEGRNPTREWTNKRKQARGKESKGKAERGWGSNCYLFSYN